MNREPKIKVIKQLDIWSDNQHVFAVNDGTPATASTIRNEIEKGVELGFDLDAVKADLESQEWETGPDGDECRSVFLGTIFSICPSGKYYQPWAAGNVEMCVLCGGMGTVKNIMADVALYKFWRNAGNDIRAEAIESFGFIRLGKWPQRAMRILETVDNLSERFRPNIECPQCGGVGSTEALLDEIWREKADAVYESRGFSIESGEGDPCDIFAVQYKSDEEEKTSVQEA